MERVNARLKVFWGVDDGNLTGSRRFVAQVGAVMAVHAAFATLLASAPRREGTLGKLRLSPIAEALRAKAKAEARGQSPGECEGRHRGSPGLDRGAREEATKSELSGTNDQSDRAQTEKRQFRHKSMMDASRNYQLHRNRFPAGIETSAPSIRDQAGPAWPDIVGAWLRSAALGSRSSYALPSTGSSRASPPPRAPAAPLP